MLECLCTGVMLCCLYAELSGAEENVQTLAQQRLDIQHKRSIEVDSETAVEVEELLLCVCEGVCVSAWSQLCQEGE